MRQMFFFIILIGLLLWTNSIVHADPPANGDMAKFNFSAPREEFSQVSLTDANEEQVSLDQFRGKIVLLNVWATWCGPCIAELPKLDKLQANVGASDFAVVPVSIDRGGSHQVMPFLKRMNVSAMTPYFDKSNSIGRLLRASRIPMTIVLGRDGQEIGRIVGSVAWDTPEATAMMQYFIEKGGDEVRGKFGKADQVALTQ